MKQLIFYLAMAAWVLTFTIHFLTFADINLANYFPIFILFIGVFIVWFATILNLKKNKNLQEYQSSNVLNRFNPVGFLNAIFKDTPFWLKCIAIGCFFYGFINFYLFVFGTGGVTGIQNGQYVLKNHGEILKTKQEFTHYEAQETRGMSGHLLIFYGIAAAILYPFNTPEKTENALS